VKLIQICAVPETKAQAAYIVALDDEGGVWECIYDGEGGWGDWLPLPKLTAETSSGET